jgi:hypothetical protein
VALAGLAGAYAPARRDGEALLGAGLGFHLGHLVLSLPGYNAKERLQ